MALGSNETKEDNVQKWYQAANYDIIKMCNNSICIVPGGLKTELLPGVSGLYQRSYYSISIDLFGITNAIE